MFVLFHSSIYVVDLMIYAISDFLCSKIIAQILSSVWLLFGFGDHLTESFFFFTQGQRTG